MKQYFAYIRVSSTRQGELGVSLPQQKDAIERYAQRNQLAISRWFEEQETAAKQGRPLFGTMVKLLRANGAAGVLIHKIDRSARNLRDWADLGELIDRGVEVHFANEALDLTSRGGRLSADIQAVVASDYIRNLREETKKGIYGRLKQGFYPMPAPLGYTDSGAAKAKTPDPKAAPLVRQAFELYATGRFNLPALGRELHRLGLRRKDGNPYLKNRLSAILKNPFYHGLIRIKKTGEFFAGVHDPLITRRTFEQVQLVLAGKSNGMVKKNDFLYRRRLSCRACGYSLIGETQKGHVYYRCHTKDCPTACVRQDEVDTAVLEVLSRLAFSAPERKYLQQELVRLSGNAAKHRVETVTALRLRVSQADERLNRLTDAYIDRLIERDLFEVRKKALLSERLDLETQTSEWNAGKRDASEDLANFIERADGAYLAYKSGTAAEKRDLLKALTSNRLIDGKVPIIMLKSPFSEIAARRNNSDGAPSRAIHLTWKPLLSQLEAMLFLDKQNRVCGGTLRYEQSGTHMWDRALEIP